MRRSDQCSAVIAEYKIAAVLPSETDKKNLMPRSLIVHPPEDYTTNLEVRVKGSTLYVYRA
jgi:hypothetical protein